MTQKSAVINVFCVCVCVCVCVPLQNAQNTCCEAYLQILFHFDRACDYSKLIVVTIVAVFTPATEFDYSWFQVFRTVLIKTRNFISIFTVIVFHANTHITFPIWGHPLRSIYMTLSSVKCPFCKLLRTIRGKGERELIAKVWYELMQSSV
jgi:hypothetical protein